jgi:hypothetical protein
MFGCKLTTSKNVKIGEVVRLLMGSGADNFLVFVSTPEIGRNKLPADEVLDSFEEHGRIIENVGRIWQVKDVLGVLDSIVNHPNLIWSIKKTIPERERVFSYLKWDWCYHCADGSWVEFFTTDEKIKAIITGNYQVEEIDFPGTIKQYIDTAYL